MTGDGRATQAAIALGWVDEEAPEIVHPRLLDAVRQWRDGPQQPISALWLSLLEDLKVCGCYDAELSCCRLAQSLFPQQSILKVRLAQILYRVGEDDEAQKILGSIAPHDPARAEALAYALKFSSHVDISLTDELEHLLQGGEAGEQVITIWWICWSVAISGIGPPLSLPPGTTNGR